MAKFDLVTVGSAGLDIFLNIYDENKHLTLNKSSNELILRSGDKIMLDGYKFSLGHNGANISVGSCRLGLKTTLFSEVGTDDFAKRIMDSLKSEGVNLANIAVKKGDSSFSVIINFQRERTIFAENIKRNHDFNFDKVSGEFIYLTSLSRNWINAYLQTLTFIDKSEAKLFFSPGSAQIEDKDKVMSDVLKRTHVLFLNKQEAADLLEKKKGFTQVSENNYVKQLLSELKQKGPEIVVITDSANGSFSIDSRGRTFFVNGYSTQIVDKTGAGDAYAAAFIYATIRQKEPSEAMIYGAINASSVMERMGAQEGLLSSDILEEKVVELTNLKAIPI